MNGPVTAIALVTLAAPFAARAQETDDPAPTGSVRGADDPQDVAPDLALDPNRGVPGRYDAAAARAAADRALAWLVESQHPDGSWGSGANETLFEDGFSIESFFAWQVAAHGLALMALAEAPPGDERDAALARGIDWLCAARRPKRGSDWDNDQVWAGLYGFAASVRLLSEPRAEARTAELEARGRAYLDLLVANQTPDGGWGYYDDPPYSRRPQWATSFCTALVLPGLQRALELGWLEDRAVFDRAFTHVQRCALPNGAYEYDLRPIPRLRGGEHINNVKGSLGRIQVCNWARAACGDPQVTDERLREGLEQFFEHHKFLDVARLRPIPHEAYYANAGYFYFFAHYYAALVIEMLPASDRVDLHERLRPHLLKTQRADGSTSDFHATTYMMTASTAYLALALELGLREES